MKKYAIFDENNVLATRVIAGVHAVPEHADEISDELFAKTIAEVDGVWKLVNGAVVKLPLPGPSFEDLKATKLARINTNFTGAAAALTEGYPEAERLTWPVQQQEAMAWAADSAAPTPYLDGLALARGIAAAEMRQKTLEQTQLFMQASQQLVGTRQRLRDLVHDARTPEALDTINWPA